MAETFADLGLRSELVDAADAAGYAAPSPLQAAAVPVLRRGGNAVLNASSGAGVVATYTFGLLDRLAESDEPAEPLRPRMLVLAPTTETADRVAGSVAGFARAIGLRVSALAPGWAGADDGAAIVVAAADAALAAVRTSRLKLGALEAVVVDGFAALTELGAGEAVETLVGLIPSEAQRVIVSAALPEAVERFVEAHVRRAMHIPPRDATGGGDAPAEPRATIDYAVVPGDKVEATAVLLGALESDRPVRLFCRTVRDADDLADILSLRGFAARRDEDAKEPAVLAGATVAGEPDDANAISYDVPFDGERLRARHADGGHVLVAPREVAHLRRIAFSVHYGLRAETLPGPERAAAGLDAFRDRVRRAASEEDLGAQWLVLEPLLDEFTSAELAAAASALLRRRTPEPSTETGPAATGPARRPSAPAPGGPPPAPWARLFMSIGRRDGIGPGDLVGAITGETGASGEQVGRIDINENFSIVEVATGVAQDVIRRMNGITLKGRSLRVDYDRKSSRGGGPSRRPRPDRR